MKRSLIIATGLVAVLAAAILLARCLSRGGSSPAGFAGSESCIECHEPFYELWAPSHHGTAMQPVTAEFAATKVEPLEDPVEVAGLLYRVETDGGTGTLVEIDGDDETEYRIVHALGGKNIYYFLTELDRGFLQVLPLAYDVNLDEWFNAPSSMVRHSGRDTDAPVDWRDRLLTFNSACYSCHVSQLSTNYDLETDSYGTTWAEPGINCETCHGGAETHVEVFRAASEDSPPENMEIISVKDFTAEQVNSMCATCHAKAQVFTAEFEPGEHYFDHFGLVTLEHPDFYPDGRDMGENYTYTGWLMSPCVKSGQLDCLHCHTSSGRYRFEDGDPNAACAPCHEDKVSDAPAHTRHPEEALGNRCISCHMPMTEFARMKRSDHSMLPPAPAASREFGSPNACNICHDDQSVDWADEWVRRWRERDYQAPVLTRARLVQAARQEDWTRVPEMLSTIDSSTRDTVVATTLIRLLMACDCDEKWPTILGALDDPSPLVRAAAAHALSLQPSPAHVEALLLTAGDTSRLVRIQAAYALTNYPPQLLQGRDLAQLRPAVTELEASFEVRRDDWVSHYNKGNYHMNLGDQKSAVESYATASRLRPDAIAPLVNASMAQAAIGDMPAAEASLRRALSLQPDDHAANLNLGLLLGEQGRTAEAVAALDRALEADPNSAVAAFNLAVLSAPEDIHRAIELSSLAAELRLDNPRYAFTHAFYLNQAGSGEAAEAVLRDLIQRHPGFPDAYALLGEIYDQQGRAEEAAALFRRAVGVEEMSEQDRYRFSLMLQARQER